MIQFPIVNAVADDVRGDLVGAYSVRLVNSDYKGPCMRVRRTGDNAEKDIGFLSNGNFNLQEMDLFSTTEGLHPGGRTCRVTTWYDQSGNGHHIYQPETTKQPRVRTNSFLELNGGILYPLFDGTKPWYMDGSFSVDTSALTWFTVIANNESGATHGNVITLYKDLLTDNAVIDSYTVGGSAIGQRYPVLATINGGDMDSHGKSYYMKNAIDYQEAAVDDLAPNTLATTGTNFVTDSLRVGMQENINDAFDGRIQEILIFDADLSANRSAIQSNQDDYYGL